MCAFRVISRLAALCGGRYCVAALYRVPTGRLRMVLLALFRVESVHLSNGSWGVLVPRGEHVVPALDESI